MILYAYLGPELISKLVYRTQGTEGKGYSDEEGPGG